MTVTTFALWAVLAVATLALTVLAVSHWGAMTVVPVLLLLVLAARWAFGHVTHDDGQV